MAAYYTAATDYNLTSIFIAQFDFFVKIVKNCISNQKPTNLTDRINRALGRRRVQYTHYLGLGTGYYRAETAEGLKILGRGHSSYGG